MADPVTLSALSIASSVGGGIMSAKGAQAEGQSAKQMYGYQAQVARLNAGIDRQNAEWELTKGGREAELYGAKAAQQAAGIRTRQAASGLDINTGTAKAVQDSQTHIAQVDQAAIRANAGKTAYDYTVRAAMDENQARVYDIAGTQAEKAAKIKAQASILGTVTSVSSKWSQGSQAGIFGNQSLGGGPIKLYGPEQTVVGYA